MHGVLCESGKQLTILNTAIQLSGPWASLELLMWPALSERLKTAGLSHLTLQDNCVFP